MAAPKERNYNDSTSNRSGSSDAARKLGGESNWVPHEDFPNLQSHHEAAEGSASKPPEVHITVKNMEFSLPKDLEGPTLGSVPYLLTPRNTMPALSATDPIVSPKRRSSSTHGTARFSSQRLAEMLGTGKSEKGQNNLVSSQEAYDKFRTRSSRFDRCGLNPTLLDFVYCTFQSTTMEPGSLNANGICTCKLAVTALFSRLALNHATVLRRPFQHGKVFGSFIRAL